VENYKSLISPELVALINKYSPYLVEARKRIVFTFSVFAVAAISGFVFYEKIIKFLITILSLEGVNVVFTSPFQFINLAISCGAACGLVITLPLLIAQILLFLKPALRKKEYRTIVRFIPFSLILFLIGFGFGALIMKWQIAIFLTRSISLGIGNMLDISGLLTTVLLTSALMGLGFQFPIVLLLLMRLGLINRRYLAGKRPWVYLGSFIFAILLPPDSILADIFLSLPLIILFELTLLLNRIFERKSGQS
jgi:sec-independent protein translocase protein TatC